ncbi:unnamed protein product, partial [Discosporangium mesarthrocarpum]
MTTPGRRRRALVIGLLGFLVHTYGLGLQPRCPACSRTVGFHVGFGLPLALPEQERCNSRPLKREVVRRYRTALGASTNGEESNAVPSPAMRAEATLRRLTRQELEGVAFKLSLDAGADSEDIIQQGTVILVERMLARDGLQLKPQDDMEARGCEEGSQSRDDSEFVRDPRPKRKWREKEPEPPLARGEREYFATCPRGLENVLKHELLSPLVRANSASSGGGGCRFRGDQSVGYRALLWVRTAHRIMELLAEGGPPLGDPIDGPEDLYELTSKIRWETLMRADQTLAVDAVIGVVPEGLTHSHFTALTVKNAVVDQFRRSGQRPCVETMEPDLPLVVYLDRRKALIYRCLSGTRSMHKRGYREAIHVASLKENLAAGLLLASGWDPDTQTLCDPMCGSGTLAIEAALIAMRRAPGLVAMGHFSPGGGGGGAPGGGGNPRLQNGQK